MNSEEAEDVALWPPCGLGSHCIFLVCKEVKPKDVNQVAYMESKKLSGSVSVLTLSSL